jgi:chromosome segregation ATPase
MQMIHEAQLTELRTTYNGSYGASLFFYPQEMTYYVALFQDKHFWRVIKSQDDTRAEAVYAGFVQQTAQLAEVEIHRTQLQVQKAFIEDVIAQSEDRAKRLQADLDVARTQQARVNDYQRQTQTEAAALRAQKEQAQAELRQVQNQVQQLQRQSESGLPSSR